LNRLNSKEVTAKKVDFKGSSAVAYAFYLYTLKKNIETRSLKTRYNNNIVEIEQAQLKGGNCKEGGLQR
jgi:hypothetical protein